jgi:hypothetical protein
MASESEIPKLAEILGSDGERVSAATTVLRCSKVLGAEAGSYTASG